MLELNLRNSAQPGGAFSTVFLLPDSGLAYKIFRKHAFDDRFEPDHENNLLIATAVWDAECEAMEIASGSRELRIHIPKYNGRTVVTNILNEQGKSANSDYHLQLGYSMQYVDGSCKKWGEVRGLLGDQAAALERKFAKSGIHHIEDSSVFGFDDPNQVVFIDFATHDYHSQLTYELALEGKLRAEHFARWKIQS